MVTPEQIENYLKSVPALPKSVRATLEALRNNELSAAAKAASADRALLAYLQHVVNSAAFGFRNELKEPAQIFSALGVQRAKQLLYAYMVSLLAPKRWRFFALDSSQFIQFQTALMARWERLVRHVGADDTYLTAAAVISAGLVVADGIFGDHREDVALIQQTSDVELDTILERVAHIRFKQLVLTIAEKWEVDRDVTEVVKWAFGDEDCVIEQIPCRLARLLHLLLFYELSRPMMLEAGANTFVTFYPEFVDPVMETFEMVVEIG